MEEKTKVSAGMVEVPNTNENANACLIVIHGSNLGDRFPLTKKEIIIGRKVEADVQIDEENVSRQHAKIAVKEDKIIIEDLNSTNGTFINTKRLKSTILKDGDLILIGNTILKFISSGNIENAYHEEMYRLATLDGLTQVYNRTYLLERIRDEFLRSRRYKRKLSLLMFDFDHFHDINEKFSHLGGDIVLKKTSSIVFRNLRKEDIIGRYGGEEFAVVLPETDEKSAFNIAEKIRILIENAKIEYENKVIPVTISIGVASLKFDKKGTQIPELDSYKKFIEVADKALYQAKEQGRNKVCTGKKEKV